MEERGRRWTGGKGYWAGCAVAVDGRVRFSPAADAAKVCMVVVWCGSSRVWGRRAMREAVIIAYLGWLALAGFDATLFGELSRFWGSSRYFITPVVPRPPTFSPFECC